MCPYNVAYVDTYHQTIISNLQRASSKILPRNRFKKFLKPKWTAEVAPFHAAMRAARVMWIKRGRPRDENDTSYTNYKQAKTIFRNKLRNVYLKVELDFFQEIDNAASVDHNKFWSLIKRNKRSVLRGRHKTMLCIRQYVRLDSNVFIYLP